MNTYTHTHITRTFVHTHTHINQKTQTGIAHTHTHTRMYTCTHSHTHTHTGGEHKLPSYDYYGNFLNSTAENGWGCAYGLEEEGEVMGGVCGKDTHEQESDRDTNTKTGQDGTQGNTRSKRGNTKGAGAVNTVGCTEETEEEDGRGEEETEENGESRKDAQEVRKGEEDGVGEEDGIVDMWLEEGRRKLEFVGHVLSPNTSLCQSPRLFGYGPCSDGGKVLCDTPRLRNASCVVYSFGVGFDTAFETSLLASTQCQVL